MSTGGPAAAAEKVYPLYVSHTLSAWGDRMWEFAAVVFTVDVYPTSLFPAALFGFVTTAVGIVFGASVGDWVDRTERLKCVRIALILQNLSLAASAGVFLLAYKLRQGETPSEVLIGFLFCVILFFSSISLLASTATSVAVEKDWVKEICGDDKPRLTRFNSVLRRIDLVCKICAPILVGIVSTLVGTGAAITFIAVWNLVSLFAEYELVRRAYMSFAVLQIPRANSNTARSSKPNKVSQQTGGGNGDSVEDGLIANEAGERGSGSGSGSDCPEPRAQLTTSSPAAAAVAEAESDEGEEGRSLAVWWKHTKAAWIVYVAQPELMASVSYCLLYVSVLNFGAPMTAFLKTQGLTDATLAGGRAAAAIMGVLSTFVMPWLAPKIGLDATGAGSVVAQALCLLPAVVAFFIIDDKLFTASVLLFVGLALSRFGLWSFDLVITQIMQERVPKESIGAVNGAQSSLTNVMYLLGFGLVMVFYKPNTFVFAVLASFGAVVMSAVVFLLYVRDVNRAPELQAYAAVGGPNDTASTLLGGGDAEIDLDGSDESVKVSL